MRGASFYIVLLGAPGLWDRLNRAPNQANKALPNRPLNPTDSPKHASPAYIYIRTFTGTWLYDNNTIYYTKATLNCRINRSALQTAIRKQSLHSINTHKRNTAARRRTGAAIRIDPVTGAVSSEELSATARHLYTIPNLQGQVTVCPHTPIR